MSFRFCSLSGLAPTIARADDLSGHKPEGNYENMVWDGKFDRLLEEQLAYSSRLKKYLKLN